MSASRERARRTTWLALFTVVSWLGLFAHNEVDLPQLTPLSVENSVPALVSVALLLAWWQLRGARPAALAMLTWSSLNLVGAVVTILPLPFLPFQPEQTVLHYLMHVIYATSQLPLIVALVAWWPRTRTTPS